MDLTGAIWHKSSRSSGNGGDCVEVADNLPDVVGVRDSKDRQGPVLVFDKAVWTSFVESIKQRGPVDPDRGLTSAWCRVAGRRPSDDIGVARARRWPRWIGRWQ